MKVIDIDFNCIVDFEIDEIASMGVKGNMYFIILDDFQMIEVSREDYYKILKLYKDEEYE